MKPSRLAIAIVPLALLAACGEDAPAPSEDSRAATGEVLEGTIDDAMLPLDRVRSHPPLIAPAPRSTGAADTAGDEEAGEEGAEEAPVAPEAATEAEAAPAESVAPPAANATPPAATPTPETD